MTNLISFGAVNWDTTLFVDSFPKPGEEVRVMKMSSVPGGTAGNIAVAAARILGGGKVGILGAVGSDQIGQRQIELFEREGVLVNGLQVVNSNESGQAFVTVNSKGENTVETFFGANHLLDPEKAVGYIRSEMEKNSVLVVTDPPLTSVEPVLKAARSMDAKVIWDPGVWISELAAKGWRLVEFADYMVLNSVEYKSVFESGRHPPEKLLAEVGANLKLVVKRGADGCEIHSDDGVKKIPSVRLEDHGYSVVNTTGCGDAFLGALGAALSLGLSDGQSLEIANIAGAFKATKSETRGSGTARELSGFSKTVGLEFPLEEV
ncbi:MAG: PfkB family carbohydrate kinase [Thermoprotei archaeon]